VEYVLRSKNLDDASSVARVVITLPVSLEVKAQIPAKPGGQTPARPKNGRFTLSVHRERPLQLLLTKKVL